MGHGSRKGASGGQENKQEGGIPTEYLPVIVPSLFEGKYPC